MQHYPELNNAAERDETAAERLDRNWVELLQELRVTQTGIQILSGFLLILPFQQRFTELSPVLLGVYLGAVGFAALSTALAVAPVAAHRLLFRMHAKDSLVSFGDVVAKVGLACVAVTVGLVVTLVLGVIFDPATGIGVGLAALLVFAVLWGVVPLTIRRHSEPGEARHE